jgi:hypothetical protein
MKSMRTVAVVLGLALLAGCASGPPKRVYPPQATLQELRVQPDGRLVANVRVQNFSTVPMTFSRLQATLTLAGHEATRIDVDPALTVGPGSNELLRHEFAATPAVKAALDDAFANGRAVRYQLIGKLASREHDRDDDFTYSSALDPVPGLPGVLR